MEFNPNYALYYPTIEFRNEQWLCSASLVWDKIYRIVPSGYKTNDSNLVKTLMNDGDIGISIFPDKYIKDTAKEFVTKIQSKDWSAAAFIDVQDSEYASLHKDKVDVELRELIIANGIGSSFGEWLSIPTSFETLYMTYLAKKVSEKNNLNIITDSTAAWTATTFYEYDGLIEDFPQEQLPAQLASIIIRDYIPQNLAEISPKKILAFREKRKYERQNFVRSIQDAAKRIAECEDPAIIKDLIEDLKEDIENSVAEYKKSADVLKVTGWAGIKSLCFPVITPIIQQLYPISDIGLNVLSATGLALGLVCGIYELKEKQRKLSLGSSFSYLSHLDRQWTNRKRGYDYNGVLAKQMNEFLYD